MGAAGAGRRSLGCWGPGRVPKGRSQERAPDDGFHRISRSFQKERRPKQAAAWLGLLTCDCTHLPPVAPLPAVPLQVRFTRERTSRLLTSRALQPGAVCTLSPHTRDSPRALQPAQSRHRGAGVPRAGGLSACCVQPAARRGGRRRSSSWRRPRGCAPGSSGRGP